MRTTTLQPRAAASDSINPPAALELLRDAAGRAAGTLLLWRRRRRDRRELAGLDARTLRDIGLTPGDAQFRINQPFWRE